MHQSHGPCDRRGHWRRHLFAHALLARLLVVVFFVVVVRAPVVSLSRAATGSDSWAGASWDVPLLARNPLHRSAPVGLTSRIVPMETECRFRLPSRLPAQAAPRNGNCPTERSASEELGEENPPIEDPFGVGAERIASGGLQTLVGDQRRTPTVLTSSADPALGGASLAIVIDILVVQNGVVAFGSPAFSAAGLLVPVVFQPATKVVASSASHAVCVQSASPPSYRYCNRMKQEQRWRRS